MRRSKKFIIITVTVAAVLAGCLGGVVFANPENGDNSQPESKCGALLDRVCEIYQENTGVAIDPQQLKDAFVQAQGETELNALESRLQSLVDQNKITQEEADQYLEWWKSKPNVSFNFGFHGFRGGPRLGGWCGPMPQWEPPTPPAE
jgi:hypothetical protein